MNTDQEKNSDPISFQRSRLSSVPSEGSSYKPNGLLEKEQNKYQQTSDSFIGYPPFQYKSMTSLNYRQQFKGSYQKVRQLFKISMINKKQQPPKQNSKVSTVRQNYFPFPRETSNPIESANSEKIPAKSDSQNTRNSGQPNFFSKKFNKIKAENEEDPILSFDKSLFNEYPYDENSFLHEEVFFSSPFVEKEEKKKKNYLDTPTLEEELEEIYDIFGSNDPFYVGWDKNLRKFVLTSRILSRPNSLLKEKPDTNGSSRKSYSENLIGESEIFSPEEEKETELDKNKTYSQWPGFDQLPNEKPQFYQFYSSWPFFKHQLKNAEYRPYFVLYEDYTNLLKLNLKTTDDIPPEISAKKQEYLQRYSMVEKPNTYSRLGKDRKVKRKKLAPKQFPISLYRGITMFKRRRDLFFTPTQRSFSWPGSVITTTPIFEYFIYGPPKLSVEEDNSGKKENSSNRKHPLIKKKEIK